VKPRRSPTEALVGVAIVIAGALGVMLVVDEAYNQVRRQMVRPSVERSWPPARRLVAGRLRQAEPLEFGAVWATRSGMICGLVNGWGSFGGLTGMTPFAVAHGRAVFLADVGQLAFASYWRSCIDDPWITLIEGSMKPGYCETRVGQVRCRTEVG
jgi:hypothetical protein